MLFQVKMDVHIPLDMPSDKANEIKAVEKAYSQDLQRQGKWRHIWRITGQYSNISTTLENVPIAVNLAPMSDLPIL